MNTSIVVAVRRRLQHAASLLLIATGLLACGGGEDALKQSAGGDLRKTALSASDEELPQALAVVGLEKISEVRIGRTIFDYTFRVSIRNDGQARGDVAAQILGAGEGTTILDGKATLLVVEAGETTAAADTITLRHNRLYPFNPDALLWSITSTRAVVISGFVIDDPVANATVEVTSLSGLSVIAKATTDQNGQYTTSSLPKSLLVSGYSVVAKGGTINEVPFVGSLRALYGLPSAYEQSHLTFLTTAAAIAAESTGAEQAQLAATAERIGNDAAARGIFPENWKDLDVATQFSTANSTVVALDGPVNFSNALALLLKGSAPPADGSTSCGLGEIAGEWECRARIGPSGGQIYSQSGVGSGDVLAKFPPMTTLAALGHAAVEVVITRSEGGNVLKFSVSTARELVAKALTTSLLRDGALFESSPQYTLPAPDFITSLNVEDACASPDHVDMPSSECLTRVSGIKPGIFVLDGRLYLGKKNYHRVPNSISYTHATTAMDGGIHRRFGATVKASANRSNLRHPVLFVHGYVARRDEVGTFGGGDATWGLFPQYVGELVDPNGVLPQLFDRYNFQWRSNASFYTAASDFADAVRYISAQHGGKKVHVIAHSFGGVLVRTALQNLTGRDADIGGIIQSVTTLGTPHSGIRDPGLWGDATVPGRPGVVLPDGWDASILEYLCGQLSCYEAGLRANIPDWIIEAHQPKPDEPVILGGLIADLHLRTDALKPHQRLLLLMGVGFNYGTNANGAFSTGDNLITLAGQRFSPGDPECSLSNPLRFATVTTGGALISERVLGLKPGTCANSGRPIDHSSTTPYVTPKGVAGNDDAFYGYSHTSKRGSTFTPEAREVEIPLICGGSIACIHDSWVSTKALLLSFHGGPPSPDFAWPMSVRSASCTAPVVGVAMVCTVTGSGLPESTNFRATNCSPSPMTVLSGGNESQRQFSCIPLSAGVPVAVSYEVPSFIGQLPGIPAVPAEPPSVAVSFVATGSMREARTGHTATRLFDGRVLVVGGDSSGNTAPYLRTAEIYSPTTGTFNPTGDMLSRRGSHTATLLSNGKVLITGGFTEYVTNRTLSSAEIYDPVTGTFRAVGDLKVKRAWHTATPLDDGRVLIAGGFDNQIPVYGTYLKSAEIFDPITETFSLVGEMLIPRVWFAATKLTDGKVLVAGGSDGYARWTGTAEVFDPATQSFAFAGSMATPRWIRHAALLNDGRVLFPGGNIPGDTVAKSTEIYDPVTKSFSGAGDMNSARSGVSVTALSGGGALVAGGSGSAIYDTAELYTSGTNTFTEASGRMVSPRYGHSATLLADGRVLLVGGSGPNHQALSAAELYVDTGLNKSSLFDDFNGSDIDATKWTRVLHPTYTGTSATVSGEELRLAIGAWLHTQGKATFTGSKIVVEGVMGDTESSILLLDSFDLATGQSAGSIMGSDTLYRGWGFSIQAGGRYPIVGPTTSGAITVAEGQNVLVSWDHTAATLYRRLTIEGNVVTFERGSSASAITLRLSTRMATSISGRPMTLVLGTGVGPYTPGRFQWIRVTATP